MPTSSFGAIRAPIVDQDGNPTHPFLKKLQEWESKLNTTLTIVGQISKNAIVQGRTEGIGTTVGQLTSAGKLASTDQIAADGTGSPLTGGRRGFVALDINSRLTGASRNNPVNTTSFFTASNPLSQGGVSTMILVAANTRKIGDAGTPTVAYNSGSVDPGVLGGWTVFTVDPTMSGGAVAYQATQSNQNLSADKGTFTFGSITTAGGGGGTGSGGGDGDFPPKLLV